MIPPALAKKKAVAAVNTGEFICNLTQQSNAQKLNNMPLTKISPRV